MGRPGQKNITKGRVVNQVVSVFHLDPPFKTAGPDGIRPGGLPRWLELLTKLAAILDWGVQSRLARTSPPGQVAPPFQLPRRPICPKSTWGVERTVSTRWISISVARSRPGRPRWTQVAFLEHPPGGVHLAKKSYRTCPKIPDR
jgi:hypothetical protein